MPNVGDKHPIERLRNAPASADMIERLARKVNTRETRGR